MRSILLLLGLILSVSVWGTDFTLTSADDVTIDGITISFAQGDGSTKPAWYDAGLRLYVQNTIAISSTSTITSITFNWEKQGKKTFNTGCTASTGTYSHPSSAGSATWTGSATSVTFTLGNTSGAQLQLNTLSVTTSGSSESTVCAEPTFSPAAGTFYGSQEIAITPSTDGASVYYTTDNSNPSSSNGTLYSAPFSITETTTIKAIAVKEDYEDSEVATATYTAGTAVTSFNIDFETGVPAAYVKWVFTNAEIASNGTNTNITARGGTYYGTTGGKATASIQTAEKYSNPGTFTCYVSRQSTNSTSSTWYIQVSEDGEDWTDAASQSATSMNAGAWVEFSADLREYSNVYVRLYYSGSTAIRNVEDISLTEASALPTVVKPTFSGDETFLTSTLVSLNTTTDGAEIRYTIDGSDPTSTSTLYSTPIELNATTTIKAIAVKEGMNNSAIASATFTKATILTPSEALGIINGWSSNKTSTEYYYVAGTISRVTSVTVNGTAEYYISNDGTTTNELQVYKGLWINGTNFSSAGQIFVGDDVTIRGKLKKYNSYKELDQNNEVVAHKPIARLSWSAASYDAELGESNTFPTLTNTNNVTVTYSSSDVAKASFTDENDYSTLQLNAVGQTTITATFAGNESYKANSVSYTLNVAAAVARGNITYNVNGGSDVANAVDQTELPDPLPTVTKGGKNFGGWYKDSEFTTPAVAGASIDADVDLYAKWLEPYTVAQARAAIDASEGVTGVYATGIVSEIVTAYSSQYGNITYNISADGLTTSDQLQAYRGKAANGDNFTSASDVQVGDVVVVFGNLTQYGDTYEFEANNQLYSLTRKAVASVAVTGTPSKKSYKTGQAFDPAGLTVTVTYDDASHATVAVADCGWEINPETFTEAGTNKSVSVKATYNEVQSPAFAVEGLTVTAAPTFNDPNHEWQLVTSDAQLEAGKYYVIGSASKGKVAGAISSDVLGTVNATIVDGTIAYNAFGTEQTADAASAVVFELGGTTGAWTLNEAIDELGQLAYKGNKTVKWETELTAEWTIAIADNNATLVPTEADSYHMLYNVSSPRFTIYTSDPVANMLLPQLYVWALKTNKLRYDANEGENAPAAQAAVAGEATVTSAEPTYEDHIFNGWNTQADGNGEAKTAGDVIDLSAGDVTLYAQWRDPVTVTVNYDANEGSGSMDADAEQVEGSTYTIKANEFTREGYNFVGWKAYDADENELTITAGKFIVPATDVTIKAQWGAWTTTDFALVTDANQLLDGDKVYLVAAGYDKAMGTQNTNYRNEVAIYKAGNMLGVLEGTEPVEFTLGKSGNKFTFKDEEGYLYAAGTANSGKNYMNTKADYDEACDWTITINESGTEIKSVANDKTPFMQYNHGSTRFSCYNTASQQAVVLYKKANYTRSENIDPAYYGTICLPKAGVFVGGALYEVVYFDGTKVFFDEVLDGQMEAGMPYIFLADGNKINIYYTSDVEENAKSKNGLYGTLEDMTNMSGEGIYMIYRNKILHSTNSGSYLNANRAYLKIGVVGGVPTQSSPAPMGRRRISMSVQGTNTATGVENIQPSESSIQKVLINSQLFIIRDEKMYNANGQLVK